MTVDPKITPKKAYRSPVLHDYGDVRTVTQAVGNTGIADGGAGKTAKTSA